MPCPASDALEAFHAQALSPSDEERIAEHLAGCAACRSALEALRQEPSTLGASEPGGGPGGSAPVTVAEGGRRRGQAPLPGLGPGSVVGRYVVVSELGQGGMGAVFAAYDPQLDRRVAIKLLHVAAGSVLTASEAAARLQREAQALARVSHPNTIAVFDVGTHAGRVFIAMEHLEGQTLRAWLKEKPRTWRESVRACAEAGRGLSAVHDAGLVHRDFKPGNVIVTAGGGVKVLDFGLARLSRDPLPGRQEVPVPDAVLEELDRAPSLETPLTQAGSLSGTPGYMAPELLSGEPATPASDQFAFGVTLYQALYGQRPFAGSTFAAVREALQHELPLAPPDVPGVPRWLYAVVRRCLASAPAARFPTMGAVLAALEKDPARARRRWALRGAVALAVTATALVSARLSRVECPSRAALLDEVWSAATRSALEAQLLQTRPDSAARVTAALDLLGSRAGAWAQQSEAACVAAGRRTATQLDAQRVACLRRRGEGLRVLIDSLRHADPAVVARSDELVDGFLRDTSCTDDAQLGRLSADDVAPNQAEMARDLRARLMRSRALDLLERTTEALAETRAVAASAQDAGLDGFEAEALSLAASIEYLQGDEQRSIADSNRALQQALAAGTDRRAFFVAGWLVAHYASKVARLGEARQALLLMEGLWVRLGRAPELELDLLAAREELATADGRYTEGSALATRRYELAQQLFGARSREAAAAAFELAGALWLEGKIDASNRLDERSIALLKELKGPEDPSLAIRSLDLGAGLVEEGRRAEAVELLETAVALARRTRDENDAITVDLTIQLSSALKGSDPSRALELAQAAVAFYEKGADSESLSGAFAARAEALIALGREREGLEDCHRSRELIEDEVDPDGSNLRDGLVCEAEAEAGLKHSTAALANWSKAYQVKPPSSLPSVRGQIALGLAQATRATGGDEQRVRELAEEALRHYSQFPGFKPERDAVEAFLAAKPGHRSSAPPPQEQRR